MVKDHMKLITVEEHYSSDEIGDRIREILEKRNSPMARATRAPGAADGSFSPVSEIGDLRLAFMDRRGIDVQIISYAHVLPAILEPEISVDLCKMVNDDMYEKASKHPDRFKCFAHLPLGDGEAAAAELERCVKELGFVGAMISGHYFNLPYDDPHYYPIYEKAVELDVPIYLHPTMVDPEITEKYYKGNWSDRVTSLFAGQGVGWHYDVGVQLVRMILAGVFDTYPDLKIMCGHWGELVSFYMYRLDNLNNSVSLKKPISDYFKENFYVNPSGIINEPQFRFCLDTFGVDHIMWGADYPFIDAENVRTMLEGYDLPEEDKEKVAHANAERILHI